MVRHGLSCCFALFLILHSCACFAAPPKQFMVVAEQRDAAQAGVDILNAGGNAIDAAVAIGYALAVTFPAAGNIGGGGFMLIHLANGKNTFINFREKAPGHAGKDMYLDVNGAVKADASTNGYLAVAVPGTVLGLDTALHEYGTMTRQRVMAPAIKLAENGYIISVDEEQTFTEYADFFQRQANVAAIFLHDGKPFPVGTRLIQRDLARTLKMIANDGPNVFYRGKIANEIVAASASHGGMLTLADFDAYDVEELPPIQCQYHQYTVLSAPPPSSGGTVLCEMLNILENFPLRSMGYRSFDATRSIVEAMRYGFRDRNILGDPNFIKNPVSQLISKSYARQISDEINRHSRAPNSIRISVFKELSDTTHFSVVDKQGNAVAVTYTLNGMFGAKVMAGNTGFFLNNEMDDFAAKPGMANQFGLVQSSQNQIAPNKRPLSSMTPTIVLQNNHVYLVLGSPGGPRIISSVLLTLLNVLDFGMNIQQAVNAPRFHYQVLPDVISTEPMALPFFTRLQLIYNGYHLLPQSYWAAVEAIAIDPETGVIHGANDVRRPDGAAIGG